jgi:hypothetical protein
VLAGAGFGDGADAPGAEAVLPDATRERLVELSQLGEDWDSYGAVPPSSRSLTMAKGIILEMMARFEARGVPTEVMPIADGGIQVEWRGPSGDLALNAAPDGSWSYLLIEHRPEGRAYTERYGLTDTEAMTLAIGFLSQ